jgi:diguanylate cyclase (GGDEF)-like protein
MGTILLIEDSAAERADIRKVVEEAGLFDRVLEATDGLQGLRLLLAESVDVVLCDLEMPGLDGEKLLRVKESRAEGHQIPFLFLTGACSTDRKVRLLEDGAADTIGKPFHAAELVARLRLHLKVKKLQDELREKNQQLARLSTTDSVTGLRSRRFVTEALALEFLRSRRYGTALSVVMADIDHFKLVNDGYGHVAGDVVLRGVADLLRAMLRATDVAGRYGGEEFLIVLPHNAPDGAEVLAERWRRACEAAAFRSLSGEEIRATISLGIAGCSARHRSPEDLIGEADAALYRAKEAGRNRTVRADAEPPREGR